MSEQEGIERIAPVQPPVAPPRRPAAWPLVVGIILAFAIGVALTLWALPQIDKLRGDAPQPVRATPAATIQPAPVVAPSLTDQSAQVLDDRVRQLEARLDRIALEAQAASGNAVRAEGLLVAVAARRALDSGAPLGYVEGQLRLRFGQAQPRAVATVINAASEPITLGDLRGGLSSLSTSVTRLPASSNWWDALTHEARELVTIRKASAPSLRPQAALERALLYIESGRVGAALAEVEHMPGRAAAGRWMQQARRYVEARRALDLIEAAAILEPRQVRAPEIVPPQPAPPAETPSPTP
ncbi:MAG: hypothetical protein ABW164_08395 [Sphingobium sp.]